MSNSIPAAIARPVHLLGSEDYIKACSTRTAMSRQALTMTSGSLTKVALAGDGLTEVFEAHSHAVEEIGDRKSVV